MRSASTVFIPALLAIVLAAPEADAGPKPVAHDTTQPRAASDRPVARAVDTMPKVGKVPEQNKAIYLGYKGHIDTDLGFDEFFAADHTVMAWYMPQYPHGDTGPIVAENGGGTWAFGQDDYREGDGGNGDAGSPVFFVQVGNKKVRYLLPEMIPGKWIHVAVVRKGDTVSLFVWGVKRTPVTVTNKATNATTSAAEIKVSGASGLPSGKLRFGRRTSGSSGDKATWQTYGLIDDIGVFTKALSGSEITSIIAAKRFKGSESGLLAGYSFEKKPPGGIALPERLSRSWTQPARAYHMPVSSDRNSTNDRASFDNPFVIGVVSEDIQLPFEKNEVWSVIYGQDDPGGSHNGFAAFCYDFVVANKPQTGDYPNGTAHAPVFAGATGKLVSYRKDGSFDGPREPYYARIRVGENEHIGYLHLEQGTLTDKATGGSCNAEHNCDVPLASAKTISKGALVGKQGPKAAHLHFSGAGVPGESMTIPIAFTNYDASDDGGQTWNHILRGHPKKGQLIRRTQ